MRSSSVLYALVFVLSTLAVSALLRMSRSASSHPARVNLLLKIYLAILVAFELVALYRLHAGHPLHEVCDFIARKKDASFTSLFAAYLQLLTAARLAPLLAPPLQRHAWLACAMTHVAEAFFVVPLAFREGALPPTLGQLELGKHGAAAFIVAMVAFNAYLFSCVAMLAACRVPHQEGRAAAAAAEEPKKGQ